jgi:hypothetical protein
MRQRYTHLDSTGRDPIAESFEPYAESIEAVLRSGVGDNGRSPWVWLRLENGDLFLATAPRGSTYEELEHDHSDGSLIDGGFPDTPAEQTPETRKPGRTYRLRCTFVPQSWVNENAIRVDGDGPLTWEADYVLDELPGYHSYESDELRLHDEAPPWVRDWQGPFEVEYQVRFTVVGFYEDGQRYAEAFWADDVEHAEEQARDSAAASDADLRIAGVVIGEALVAA